MDRTIPLALSLCAAVSCLAFAVIVLVRHPHKVTHRAFALLSCTLSLWAIGIFAVIQSETETTARWCVTFTEIVACFIPPTFYTFVGFYPKGRFEGNRRFLAFTYAAASVLGLATLTPWYIRGIEFLPDHQMRVQYGPAFVGMCLLYLGTARVIYTNLVKKLRYATGIERRQIQNLMFAIYSGLAVSLLTNILAPIIDIRLFQPQAYGALCIIFVMGFLAYAMIRYHLLDARILLSRTILYLVLIASVILTFAALVKGGRWLTGDALPTVQIVPFFAASLLIILVFHAVKDRLQRFIDGRLLRHRYDIHRLYARIAEQASEEVQLAQLLDTVAQDIRETIGVAIVRVLLLDEEDSSKLVTEFSSVPGEARGETREHVLLLDYFRAHPGPLLLEQILHQRPDTEMTRVAQHLAELEAYFCLPLKTNGRLVGIMTLGQKDSHDMYSAEEAVAFSALAGPLGTAVANARLYGELEKVNLHLSRVFGQMREGVVAVDIQGNITTVNAAALNIIGPVQSGESLDTLSPEVAHLLRLTLERDQPVSDFEALIKGPTGEAVPVIMSSSCLRIPGNGNSGAIALIYDLSQVKRLEQNVIRADRLSSIGTLAAGMAHEIKNPLVSIKTFAQLLLTRFQDPDFRDTFTDVVPQEVDRIDTIVSRLLDFARPKPVEFQPQNLQSIVNEVLALVENETYKGHIVTTTDLPEEAITIHGDEQQLHQVFLNLLLNAIESMKEAGAGTLHVQARLALIPPGRPGPQSPGRPEAECARVSITDTGCGIPHENLQDLFTPFYTTKSEGCGLGLAVVHGIVSEHGGEIDVSSVLNRGTTVTVTLPLATAPAPAEMNG